MIPEMDTLLANYEHGLLSRRELLGALAVVAAPAGRQAADGVLRGRNLNHVNLQVADVDRSVEFYRTLFSLPPKRAVPNRPFVVDLDDGSFLSLQASDRPGRIDHFDVGVDDFSPEPGARRHGAAEVGTGPRLDHRPGLRDRGRSGQHPCADLNGRLDGMMTACEHRRLQMGHRLLMTLSTLAVIVLLGTVPATAQGDVAADGWTPPRTADGRPDLQGVWDYRTMTPLERPDDLAGKQFFTDEEAAAFERESVERRHKDRRTADGLSAAADVANAYNEFWWDYGKKLTRDKRTSLIVDPPDGRIPRTEAAEERAAARREARRNRGPAAGPEDRGLWERCITRSVPRLSGAYNNNFQLFQSADHVVILNEMIHEARIVPLDGRPHIGPQIGQWLGDSRGRWEGDTLVIDTTNFTGKTNFRGSGRTLHLVERFTRVDPETLLYQVTIEDPTTFAAPWTFVLPATRNASPIYEYACHEGNYGMFNLLAGARAEDAAAKQAKESK